MASRMGSKEKKLFSFHSGFVLISENPVLKLRNAELVLDYEGCHPFCLMSSMAAAISGSSFKSATRGSAARPILFIVSIYSIAFDVRSADGYLNEAHEGLTLQVRHASRGCRGGCRRGTA